MSKSKNNNIIGGLIWSFGERISAQLVSTVVSIIIARILSPDHYGIISIVTIFISFLNVFVTAGFGNALVQKKDSNKLDFDTAFILGFCFSLVLYLILFICAPFIAKIYSIPELIPLIRVMGIGLPIASVNSIQHASVQKSMKFKKFFYSTLVGTIASGIIGIIMAFYGFGVWALATQHLASKFFVTAILFVISDWKPGVSFSLQSAKSTWSFGWKLLCARLISTLQTDIAGLLVGKKFGTADLAYYDQGKKYPALLMNNINNSIDKVMLPAYSKEQENKEKLLTMLRRSVRTGVYILAPILLGFAMVAKNFVLVVLTEKWIECVPFIQLFCLSYITRPLESSCHQALIAIGKNTTALVCISCINIATLTAVLISCFLIKSVLAVAAVSLLTTLVSLTVFLFFINKNLNYKLKEQISDILPSILISVLMCLCVYLIGLIKISAFAMLALQVLIGIIVYIILSVIFKIEPFVYLLGKVLNKLNLHIGKNPV